jgi:hypothetical protein
VLGNNAGNEAMQRPLDLAQQFVECGAVTRLRA